MPDALAYYQARERECNARRRMGALRDDVEAAPVFLFPRGADVSKGHGLGPGVTLVFAQGELPRDDDEALSRINLNDANGSKALTKDDVYIHYVEAANGSFIPDRFMFLDASTLKNCATHASDGFSFLNSHRDGGLSAPADLPLGRTFAGRYEEFATKDGGTYKRAVLGLYMIRGISPNGKSGPSTDDLHKAIEGGTLSDVSMGLSYGSRVCDVCAQDLTAKDDDGKYICPHAPGTHRKMTDEQKGAQEKRGVRGGRASYSLVDAIPREVSAVFKGAVPGAGFRKARQFALSGDFSADEGRELLSAYGPLWGNRERSKLSRGGENMKFGDLFNFWNALGRPKQLGIEGGQLSIDGLGGVDLRDLLDDDGIEDRARATGAIAPARLRPREANFSVGTIREEADPEIAQRLAQADERNRKAAEREARADAREFLGPHRQAGRINKSGADRFEAAYVLAALDDELHPIKDYKRVEALKFLVESRPKSALMDEDGTGDLIGDEDISLKPGEKALNNGPDNSPPPAEVAKEKRFRLHAMSPSGMQFLRNDPEGKIWLAKNGLS
jgi:hypothetical protein